MQQNASSTDTFAGLCEPEAKERPADARLGTVVRMFRQFSRSRLLLRQRLSGSEAAEVGAYPLVFLTFGERRHSNRPGCFRAPPQPAAARPSQVPDRRAPAAPQITCS